MAIIFRLFGTKLPIFFKIRASEILLCCPYWRHFHNSRPAFRRPRPKVTIIARAYTLQSIWHIFYQNLRSPILHTKEVFLQTIWHIFHQNLRSPILHTKEVFLQTIWHIFHQNLSSPILHTKEVFLLTI